MSTGNTGSRSPPFSTASPPHVGLRPEHPIQHRVREHEADLFVRQSIGWRVTAGPSTSRSRGPIDSIAAWRGTDLRGSEDWIERLDDADRAALVAAVVAVRAAGRSRLDMTAADFPLGAMAQRVAGWLDELDRGRGFLLARGLPLDELDDEGIELMYYGLGLHLGEPVSQNAAGDLLGHVRDSGADPNDPSVRLYRTRERLSFHSDGADIICLLCLQPARSGGESLLASTATVYNQILERRPDLVDELFRPFPFDRNEEQAPGEPPYFQIPLAWFGADRFSMFYIGWYIRDSQRHSEAPRLSERQVELIDLIDEIAEDPLNHLEMTFERGDLQLAKNAALLHSRHEYVDHAEPERRRHLLRLWLAARSFDDGHDALRGGIPERTGSRAD